MQNFVSNFYLFDMKISIIVAATPNGVIGKNNQLLWKLSADLKNFKQLTSGHSVVMGRKTFDSIGRPLPNRNNIVITHQTDISFPEGVLKVHSLDDALALAKNLPGNDEIFIIGGGQIYAEAIGVANKIYFTLVKANPDGDAFFPAINLNKWCEVSRKTFSEDEKNEFAFDIIEYESIEV